jgi:hypothetical protein
MPPRKRIKKIPLDNFRSSASSFRQDEEHALKIRFKESDDFTDIFDSLNTKEDELSSGLKELALNDFGEPEIKTYIPSKDDGLSTRQRRFLVKLRQVLINNDPDSEAPNCERFVDDLISFVCECAELDDGLELTLRPSNLYLQISNSSFAAMADREGRRGIELTWLVQEDKHRRSSTYLHGDLQLACALIAAFQQNYNLLEEIYPCKILAIKVIAETVFFCSMKATEDYLEELLDDLPTSEVFMYKYPKNGLSLSVPNEREIILRCLTLLRKEALTVEKRSKK